MGQRRWQQGLVAGGLAAALWLLTLARGAGGAGLPADLQRYLAEALTANPEIRQAAAVKEAAQAAVRAAGALDDPMLHLGVSNLPTNTFSFSREDMTMKVVGLSQRFPFPGKRRLRTEAATDQAKEAEFSYLDKINEVRGRLIQAYWGLAFAYAAADLTQKNKDLWTQAVRVAETRYGTGQGSQTEVLQAQVELGNYLDRLLTWQQQQQSWRATLNALRGQPPHAPLSRPVALQPRNFDQSLDELLVLLEARPQLQALKTAQSRQEKLVALARKDFLPDFNLGVEYGFRENGVMGRRPDFFTAYIQLNLPLWFPVKQAPRLREEQARMAAATEAYQALILQLRAAVTDRFQKLSRLHQQIQLYQTGLVPQAQQAARAAQAAYQVGGLEFARLIQTQLAAYDTELKLQEYLKEFEETWADLEFLVGSDLPRLKGK